jgi:hypothetical protein
MQEVVEDVIKLWEKVNLDSDIPSRGGIMMELDRLILSLKESLPKESE